MTYRVLGLSAEPFRPLYGLPDAELVARGVQRVTADAKPGYPDRVELRDAEPGETLLLLNWTHQPADTPYRASHAIFVREGAEQPHEGEALPEAMRIRPLSLRAWSADGHMLDADLVDGAQADAAIRRMLDGERVAYLHAHYARRGCYAARIERA